MTDIKGTLPNENGTNTKIQLIDNILYIDLISKTKFTKYGEIKLKYLIKKFDIVEVYCYTYNNKKQLDEKNINNVFVLSKNTNWTDYCFKKKSQSYYYIQEILRGGKNDNTRDK